MKNNQLRAVTEVAAATASRKASLRQEMLVSPPQAGQIGNCDLKFETLNPS